MNIEVCANGVSKGKGTHISVFVHIREGTHDNELKWPFVGDVTYVLLNQEKDEDHHKKKTRITNASNLIVGSNWGRPCFISHAELSNKPYLKNDSLYFRVSVEIADHKPWLE